MTTISKQAIAADLVSAMQREELHTREAAKYLNLNPCYLSMAQNSKSWDSMGKAPWVRLNEWWETRDLLSKFQIPEGEEIWKPKEKPVTVKQKAQEVEKSFRKVMKDHVKRVIERNEPDNTLEPLKYEPEQTTAPANYETKQTAGPLNYELKQIEPAHIPITLDLKINVEICLFGKTINIPLS